MVFCATCNEHSLRRHEKTGVNNAPPPPGSRVVHPPPPSLSLILILLVVVVDVDVDVTLVAAAAIIMAWQPPSQWGAVGKVTVRWPNCVVLPRAMSPVGVAVPRSLRCRHRPCLRHHGSHCCCRQQRRLLCHLLRCLPPDLLSAAFVIVRLSTLSPSATVPYRRPSPAAVLSLLSRPSITFAAPVNGWLLRSPPAQQHTN